MKHQPDFRRYLVSFDASSLGQVFTDTLIIGAGIAGVRAALEAAQQVRVLLLCKGTLDESNTWHAQGGIAAVFDPDDSLQAHIKDTLLAGGGLSDEKVVDLVIRSGPALVQELVRWGAAFDRHKGRLALAREGGHSASRIVHAHGDATGQAITNCLINRLKDQPAIRLMENTFVVDLLSDQDRCVGALIAQPGKELTIIWAKRVILAAGGIGQMYRETTNPPGATGDGYALAYRAGARLEDMEMIQFHPTTLYVAGASRTLISEAVRGEGATLLDHSGYRFMPDYHPDAELAPRDIVSRAILQQMAKTGRANVFLDVRHMGPKKFRTRFPHICAMCESFDITPGKDLIPVRPSAHYMIGGVTVDINGQTSLQNLYACGEVAATSLHGANRLGSNSLLEGLVFGKIAGEHAAQAAQRQTRRLAPLPLGNSITPSHKTRLDVPDVRNSLRSLMWRNVGMTRDANHLAEAIEIIEFWSRYVMDKVFDEPQGWECQNMLTIARTMAAASLARQESRGVHFRSDFPQSDEKNWRKHITFTVNDPLSQLGK
ncbi:MAG: L-aspartate oxidase [Phycisphaerae bacterium]|nr:L-aspartate oxidase [Phycisphaerae bacterium]